jgi:hypothetical protein
MLIEKCKWAVEPKNFLHLKGSTPYESGVSDVSPSGDSAIFASDDNNPHQPSRIV